MASYRILEESKYESSCAKTDDSEKVRTVFRVEMRKWFRWVSFEPKGHPLWRLFSSLEEAKDELDLFLWKETHRKKQKRTPKVAYYCKTGLI